MQAISEKHVTLKKSCSAFFFNKYSILNSSYPVCKYLFKVTNRDTSVAGMGYVLVV